MCKRNKHRLVAPLMPPTTDLVRNPGMCPDWEWNWGPFGLQDDAQPTKPQQSGLNHTVLNQRKEG